MTRMTADERIVFMYNELPIILEKYAHLALRTINPEEWDVVYGDYTEKSESLGTCDYATKTIYVSDRHICDETFKDTFYHEVAHILAIGDGHGRIWRKFATLLGANPRAAQKGLVSGVHYEHKKIDKKWLVVYKDSENNLEIVETAGRRLKNLSTSWIGYRLYTKGNLWLIDTKIYNSLSSDSERIVHLVR